MIHKETLTFLAGLKANNHKDWFEANRKTYQEARNNFLEVTDQLIQTISTFDEDIAQSQLDPKKCIMRINRDIRFSADKSPYKSNFFAFINKEGKKSPYGGYYFSVDPEESFQGGGVYMPESSFLSRIRQEIDFNFQEWDGIVTRKPLIDHYQEVKASGKLVRPPKGYEKDNPAIEWIKYKGFYTQKMLSEEELLSADLIKNSSEAFKAIKPMVDFINRSMD